MKSKSLTQIEEARFEKWWKVITRGDVPHQRSEVYKGFAKLGWLARARKDISK